MKKSYPNPLKIHSKSKLTLQLSPKPLLKPTHSRIPGILIHSLDSHQLHPKPTYHRLQTPPQTPSHKSLKTPLQKPTHKPLQYDKNLQQNRLIGKSTVKLQINLYEPTNVLHYNDPNPITTINNISKLPTPRKPMTPQPKIISFNLDLSTNNNNDLMNPTTISTVFNPPNHSKPSTSTTHNLPLQPPSTPQPISQPPSNPTQIDQKTLISTIQKTFSFKQRPPNTTPAFYRIKQPLGKGSFGKVMLYTQTLTEKPVAIKVIEKAHLKNSISEKRVLQEIQLLRRLDHRNIVRLLEVFDTETTIYLVMEYLDRGDLYSLLKSQKKGRLTEKEIKPLFLQIIRGLDYIHSQGILHRDIKLDNILLDQSFNIKICDFGISRTIIPNHRMTEQSGTPAFMAPEIVSSLGYEGFGSDLWSLGVVLYCLLTGTLPFRGNCASELNQNIMKGVFNKEIKVSEEAKNLLERLLEVNPERRISIKEIWGHPWVSGEVSCEETVSLLQKGWNEEIVKKIEGYGFPKEFIVKNVEGKTLGHVNVCYYSLSH